MIKLKLKMKLMLISKIILSPNIYFNSDRKHIIKNIEIIYPTDNNYWFNVSKCIVNSKYNALHLISSIVFNIDYIGRLTFMYFTFWSENNYHG